MDFKVGDKVRVVNGGAVYSTHSEFMMENKNKSTKAWMYERSISYGTTGEINAISYINTHTKDGLAAIVNCNEGSFIIHVRGLEKAKQNMFTWEDVQRDEATIDASGVMIKETPSIDVELKISDIVKEERYYIETNLGRFDVTDQVKNILHMEGK